MRPSFRFVTSTLFALAVSSTAMAADGDWTGFSAGVSVGYVSLESDWQDKNYWYGGDTQSYKAMGASIGLVGAYDRQFESLVVGAILDVDYTTIDDTSSYDESVKITNTVTWLASLRARGGIAQGSSLIYLTAGLAMGGFDHEWQDSNSTPGQNWDFSNDNVGFVYGMGLEHRISGKLSVRAELLQYSIPGAAETNESGTTDFTMKVSEELTAFKISANYHF